MEITLDDCLWAARGILGECGPFADEEEASACLWAILRRCLLLPNTRGYGEMWRMFSQPINPAWAADGKFCAPGGAYDQRAECSPAREARRAKIAAMTWEKIPTQITGIVLSFGMGQLFAAKYPGLKNNRLSNWAAYPGVEKKFPWGIDIGGNWFFEDKNLMEGEIRIEVQIV
jgi:hypothetical protein